LSAIPRENALITENFLECLYYTSNNLLEVPTFFLRSLKNTINGLVPRPASAGDAEKGASAENSKAD
jgi:hypothetical protein